VSTGSKLGLLGCLYFSQGLPYGFFTKTVPFVMSERDLALGAISLTSLLYLPWALKFLWAPLVDRHGATRKAWLVPLQAAAMLALVAVSFLDPGGPLTPILVGLVLINLVSATQDIPTDATAVDLLAPHERGLGNGVQVGAYRVGMVVGGGFVLMSIDVVGWQASMLNMALMVGLVTLPLLAWRAPTRAHTRAPPIRAALGGYLRRPGVAGWLAVLLLYKGFDAIAGPMPVVLAEKVLGYSATDIGVIYGIGGSSAALLGAIVGGLGVRRLGRVRALLVFGLLQAVAVGLYALPAAGHTDYATLTAVVCADAFFGTLATVALFTMMMDASRPESGATDYTVQASVVVVAAGLSGSLGGFCVSSLGWVPFFLAVAGLTLVGLAAAAWLIRRNGVPVC